MHPAPTSHLAPITGRAPITGLGLAALALALLASLPAAAQYGGGDAPAADPAAGGLPPFLAAMKRHDITIAVSVRAADGSTRPAPADLAVGLRILAGGSKVRDYHGRTDAEGRAKLGGVPSNPEVQGMIEYEGWVDYQGVRFPHRLDGIPVDGAEFQMTAHEVTTDTAAVSLEHNIEAFPDEESLVVRHVMRIYNDSPLAVNLAALPGGGLKLSTPAGAKHPELHDEHDPTLEVRGTDVWFKGALLPAGVGRPADIRIVYTLPWGPDTYEWSQTLPVKSVGLVAVVPQHKQPQAREAIPMTLATRGGFGAVETVEPQPGQRYQVLRSEGATVPAGEPLRFAIGNLPTAGAGNLWLMLVAVFVIAGFLAFGFKKPPKTGGAVLSRSHLVAERDRLVKALARMRRAVEKGRMSAVRFEREREAIVARLVSLYRALDRLDAR